MSGHENAKPMITDVFVKGAVQGWNIAASSTIPNVLMAFVIIKILEHSGLLALIGSAFGPLMGVFGLPGEAATVLLGVIGIKGKSIPLIMAMPIITAFISLFVMRIVVMGS